MRCIQTYKSTVKLYNHNTEEIPVNKGASGLLGSLVLRQLEGQATLTEVGERSPRLVRHEGVGARANAVLAAE